MPVRLVRLSGQVKVRIGTVNCPYSSRSNGVRIVVTLVTSVTSGTPVTLVWLVTLLTLVTLEASNTSVISDASIAVPILPARSSSE